MRGCSGVDERLSAEAPPTRRTPHLLRHTHAMTSWVCSAPACAAPACGGSARSDGHDGFVLLFRHLHAVAQRFGRPAPLGLKQWPVDAVVLCVLAGPWSDGLDRPHHGGDPPHGLSRDAANALATTMVASLCCLAVAAPSLYAARTSRCSACRRDRLAHDPAQVRTATAGIPAVGQDDPWKTVPRVIVLLIGSDAGADGSVRLTR